MLLMEESYHGAQDAGTSNDGHECLQDASVMTEPDRKSDRQSSDIMRQRHTA